MAKAAGLKRRIATSMVAALLAYIAVALAVEVGSAQADLHVQACKLLGFAGAPKAIGSGGQVTAEVDGCVLSKCLTTYADPDDGEMKCEYGRSGIVTLSRAPTAKRAKRIIRNDMKKGGYRPLKVKADVAGLVTGPPGSAVVMAVGRVTVVFGLAAFSDDPTNFPVWDNQSDVKKGAREIADWLRSNPHFTG